MEPPLRSFVNSMTTKEGLKSLPDRLFVQEYLSAYTYPDIMEIIHSLFLNYFATLRIPLTLPAICRIISLAIQLFVQKLIHASTKRSYYWLSVRVSVIVRFPQIQSFELNSVNSSPNPTNTMWRIGTILLQ